MADEPGAIGRLTLAIRAITDTAERQAAISARLSLAVEGYTDELIYQRRRAEEIERLQSETPAAGPIRNVVTIGATAQSIGLLGPTLGRTWAVQSIAVGGVTPTTAAAGTADVIQAPGDPTLTAVDLTSWRDHTATLPAISWYTAREFTLRHPDQLWIVINNGTNGQQYSATAWIVDYQDGGYINTVGL